MKKFFALLLSVMMMFTMLTPAMAESQYETLEPDATSIHHSLSLTEATIPTLAYDIVYRYSVGDVQIIDENGDPRTDITVATAISGKPTIDDIIYGPQQLGDVDPDTPAPDRFPENEIFTEEKRTVNKTTTVNWDDVDIMQPGIYRWPVTQSVYTEHPYVVENPDKYPTNMNGTFWMYMYVNSENDVLTAEYFAVSSSNVPNTAKTDDLTGETFPPKANDLTLTKSVSGNQASKDQYFKFTITLTAPEGDGLPGTKFTYDVEATTEGSYETTTEATAYQPSKTNPTYVDVTNGQANLVVWLKHGQSVTIKDIVYGSKYTIVESENTGYVVSATDDTGADKDGEYDSATFTQEDERLTDDAIVVYTNEKKVTTPTGIDLQSGAAFAGFILAMGLMIVMFIGKRKEQAC